MKLRIFFVAIAVAACVCASARTFTTVTPESAVRMAGDNPSALAELHARFLAGDTTLTIDEVATVYFAAPQREGYTPASSLTMLDDAFRAEDYVTALPLSLKALEGDPTSLDATVKAIVSIKLSGARIPDQLRMLTNRYDMLSLALLSTGQGTSPESPFVVRSKADQFRILTNIFQVEKIVGYCDIAGCNAAKVILPDCGGREVILYFRILENQ